jgi:hypothetical protein
VVVCDGCTNVDPLGLKLPRPEILMIVAFVDDQERVEFCPWLIVVGFAPIEQVGAAWVSVEKYATPLKAHVPEPFEPVHAWISQR